MHTTTRFPKRISHSKFFGRRPTTIAQYLCLIIKNKTNWLFVKRKRQKQSATSRWRGRPQVDLHSTRKRKEFDSIERIWGWELIAFGDLCGKWAEFMNIHFLHPEESYYKRVIITELVRKGNCQELAGKRSNQNVIESH